MPSSSSASFSAASKSTPELRVNGSPVSAQAAGSLSSRSTNSLSSSSDDAAWGANFWVTLIDPETQATFFACPATGEVSWDPPVGNFVLPADENGQWWEIVDDATGVPYYYHTKTNQTEWVRPQGTFVIPLSVIQNTALGKRLSKTLSPGDLDALTTSLDSKPAISATTTTAAGRRASQIRPTPSSSSSRMRDPTPSSSSSNTKRPPIPRRGSGDRADHRDREREHYRGPSLTSGLAHLPPIPASDASAPPSPAASRRASPDGSPGRSRRDSGESRPSTRSSGKSERDAKGKNGERADSNGHAHSNGSGSPSSFRPPRSPPQSLDAAAELFVRPSPSGYESSPEGKSGQKQPIRRSSTDGGTRSSLGLSGRKSGGAGMPRSVSGGDGGGGTGGGRGVPKLPLDIPRSQSLKPHEIPLPRTPRTPVAEFAGGGVRTMHGKEISGPIPNADATANMTPVKRRAEGRPILVEKQAHPAASIATLRSGAHPVLPGDLASDIQQFVASDFARQYFATHRTGLLFKRTVPMAQMMAWQRTPLSSPLLNLPRNLHRDALKIFRIVQRVMGEALREGRSIARCPDPAAAAAGRDPASLALLEEERWILAMGILHGELRDEIYCQVVKQLTGNPAPDAAFKGWQLLCALLGAFPPSKNFEGYLGSFLRSRTAPPPPAHAATRADIFAKHALKRLAAVSTKGPRGKPPTVAEIEAAHDAAFNPSTFGEPLHAVLRLQERTYPDAPVPIVLPFLADAILALGGTRSEGIFRVPGDGDAVADLRLRIDKGFYTLTGVDDPHVPASLFKLWLRELPDALVPDEMYNECIAYAREPEACVGVVSRLPTANRRVVLFVVSFLQMFLEEKILASTKMTSANLALVMAPNLLRCASDSMAVVFTNAQYEQTFVHNLLVHLKCDEVDPDYVPKHGLGAATSRTSGR